MMMALESKWIKRTSGATSDGYYEKNDSHLFLKLFNDSIPNDIIEQEYSFAKHIYNAGNINIPKPLEILEIDNRKGIIFERINGKTFANLLQERLISLQDCAEEFAKEVIRLHDTPVDTTWLPTLYDEMKVSIDYVFLLPCTRRLLHRALEDVYDEFGQDVFLHGDLHPGNLMWSESGNYWIDIGNVGAGPAVFDLASAYTMLYFPLTYLFLKNQYGLTIKESKQSFSYFLESYLHTDDKKVIAQWNKKLCLCGALYTCDVVRKEKWSGAVKAGVKLLILMICSQWRRYL